ncbi:hypothetical protein ACP4OV_010036 [Aristida adscensionis]
MAGRLRQLAGLLPEVRSPTGGAVPLRQKAAYTAASLAVFLVGSHLQLYGTGVRYSPASAAADPLYWMRGIGASNGGTVMALGVVPLLVSEGVAHLLLGHKNLRRVVEDHDRRFLLDGAVKFLAILVALMLPVSSMLASGVAAKLCATDAILIVLQLFFGGLIVIYLDEALKKGYGLLSAIPLFTAANICANIFWKAFGGDQLGGQVVVSSSVFHRLIATGDDEPSAMRKALSHGDDLPGVAAMLATCVFFLIVLSLQGLHVRLPLRPRNAPGLQLNYTIRLSYLCFAPLLFHEAMVSLLYLIPKMLYTKFGQVNKVVSLLGKWKESKYFGEAVPISGIAYYATKPPTDPLYTCIYAVLLLLGCAASSTAFFAACANSDRYVARLFGERRGVTVAQPDSVPQKRWRRYVAKVAFLVGICIGALTLVAGLAGVLGSGTGIMLAVTIIYSCFQGRGAIRIGAFGL